MVDHIYGRINLIVRTDRPNMFIKELRLYLDYLKERIAETNMPASVSQVKYFETFQANISNGIQYYKELFSTRLNEMRVKLEKELFKAEESFNEIRKSMAEKNLISAIADEIVEKITEHTTV
jgi:signal recognition particle GTPase